MPAITRDRLVRAIVALELPLVIAITPALLFPSPRRLAALAIVPVIWWCARRTTGRWVPGTPMNGALGLLLVMVGVSLHATFDVRFSLGKVSGVVLGVLLFWAIARWVTTDARLRIATGVFVLAGAALAVIALLGVNSLLLGLNMPNEPGKYPVLTAITKRLPPVIRGLPGAEEGFNPNAVAGCLVLFLPVQVALLGADARRWMGSCLNAGAGRRLPSIVQIVLLGLTAATLLLMQSRGAWAATAAAAAVALIWSTRPTRLVPTVIIGAALITAVSLRSGSAIVERLNMVGPSWDRAVSGRMELWSRGVAGIRDYPWTGMGMNAFRRIVPLRYPMPQAAGNEDVAHAHNHLLQAGLDLGLPGLIAYLAVWLIAASLLVAVYRGSKTRAHRLLAGGLGAGLLAHFGFGLTDVIPLGSKVGVLFWLTLGLVVALRQVALDHEQGPSAAGTTVAGGSYRA